MSRLATALLCVAFAALLCACGGTAIASSQRSSQAGSGGLPRGCPRKSPTERYDPRDAIPLPGNGIAPAVNGAIYESQHEGGITPRLHRGAVAYQAAVAHQRGFTYQRKSSVELYCGTRIAQRTVVVNLFFPHALPSASLSYSQVWISRFADGYHVWFIFH